MKNRNHGNSSDCEKGPLGGCFPRNLDKIENGDRSNFGRFHQKDSYEAKAVVEALVSRIVRGGMAENKRKHLVHSW